MANLLNGLGGSAGFGENILARNDDGSTPLIDLRAIFGAQGLNFFGRNYTGLYLNNNGSVTFGVPSAEYTPQAITGSAQTPIIAAFWADVDTEGGPVAATLGGNSTGSNLVYHDLDAANRRFVATWDDVGYFNDKTNRLNAFQLILTAVGTNGDFDIAFRYEDINWTTGDADGTDGLGGNLARVGYSSGNGVNFLSLGQAASEAGLLGLETASNVGTAGVFRFTVRNGATTPAISIGDVVVSEGNGPGGNLATIPVFLAAPSAAPIVVRYTTRGVSAIAGTDFGGQSGVLTFAPGITQANIFIDIIGDSLVEGDEQFAIDLSDAQGAPVATGSALVTIGNDDGFVISDVSQFEGTSGTPTPFVFSVSRGTALTASVDVGYVLEFGSAGTGDAQLSSGRVAFAPGQTSRTITVNVTGDAATEGDESFTVRLVSPQGLPIADDTGLGTIRDDDGFVIDDLVVTERTGAAPTTAVVSVRLLSALPGAATVNWATAPGSAGAPADFTASGGTLNFAPGETLRSFSVPIIGDGNLEGGESFVVRLSQPIGATIVDDEAVVEIVDDDGVSISDALVIEDDTGTINLQFTVSLGSALTTTASVGFASVAGSAAAGSDFAAIGGTLSFGPGVTSQTVTVVVSGDLVPEADETLTVGLSNPVGTAIVRGTATGTIFNDDGLSALDTVLAEGPEGVVGSAVVRVQLSAPAASPVTVAFTTQDGTATAGSDYIGTSGTLTFAPGVTEQLVAIDIIGNAIFEGDETFRLVLSNPGGSVLVDGSATVTITNDDAAPPPSLRIVNATIVEGSGAGATTLRFQVALSQPLAGAASASFATTAGTAAAGSDFTPRTGVVTIPAGSQFGYVDVVVARDLALEADEAFTVALSAPSAGVVIDGVPARGLILNDDAPSVYSIVATDADRQEGPTGAATPYRFVVSRTGDLSAASIAVTLTGSGHSGLFPAVVGDFVGGFGAPVTLNLTSGEATQIVTVNVRGDRFGEFDEGFVVTLSAPPAGAIIGTASANGIIRNDDVGGPPTVSLRAIDVDRAEGAAGTSTQFVFEIERGGSNLDIAASFDITLTGSGANPAGASDFSTIFGTAIPVNFAAEEIVKRVFITVAGDDMIEGDEEFSVTLSVSNGTIVAVPVRSGIIRNDDLAANRSFSIAATAADGPEGGVGGMTPYLFTITRSGDLAAASVAVTLTGSGPDPAVAADFVGGFGAPVVFAFAAGEASRTVTVNAAGDNGFEADEGFTVTLSAPSPGSEIGTASATGVIRDDDTPPGFAIVAVNADRTEGANGTVTPFTFLVTRVDTAAAATIDVALTGSGANPATIVDFLGGFGSPVRVAFAPGEASRPVTVNVRGDSAVEAAEDFVVTLSNPSAGVINAATAFGTIRNDDAPASFAITAAASDRPEGAVGNATQYLFTISRSGDLAAASVDVTLTGSGANSATIDDFLGGFGAPVAFAFGAGEASRTVTVNVTGDSAGEFDEGFSVTLSNPSAGMSIGTTAASGIIHNDDVGGALSFSVTAGNADRVEGAVGTATGFFFTVSREGLLLGEAATVNVTLTGAGANPASIGDFVGGFGAPVQLAFAPGVASQAVTVTVAGDGAFEPDEGFVVTLSDPSQGFLQAPVAQGVIRNDDQGVFNLAGNLADQIEGGSGIATGFTYTVTRTGDIAAAASVSITLTGSGSEFANIVDFVGGFGAPVVVAFAPGEAARVVTVNVAGDTAVEADEAFILTLSAPSANMRLGTATASGIIRNDDNNPFVGTAGDDIITGTGLGDPIFALAGNDVINGFGGIDIIDGGPGNDTINGGMANDVLTGGDGVDTINGGRGGDTMTGGSGDDVFVLVRDSVAGDWITDFFGNGAAAGDSIQFLGWGAGSFVTAVMGQPEFYAITDGVDQFVEVFRLTGSLNVPDFTFG